MAVTHGSRTTNQAVTPSLWAGQQLKAPRATRGPFRFSFVDIENIADPASYRIHVSGRDGKHAVFRRYSNFVTLRACLSTSGLAGAADLPPLPPKSFFRKSFSSKFMFERAACLRRFFKAVEEVDCFVVTEAFRQFLAIRETHSISRGLRATKTLQAVEEGLEAETVVEGEAEYAIESVSEDSFNSNCQADAKLIEGAVSGDDAARRFGEIVPEDSSKQLVLGTPRHLQRGGAGTTSRL